MPNTLKRLLLLLIVLLAFGVVAPADAHGYIVRSIPENRAVLERPPTRLQYWFSEALERDFSEMNLRNQQGEVLATGGVSENDNTLMTLRVPEDLSDGAYIVELRPAFASDGHVVASSRVFFVGEEIGGVAGAEATDQAIPLEVVWRAITLTANMLLFGAFTLYSLVLLPAWGSKKYPAGLLPPRVMRRLNVIVGYALLAAFAGNILALFQQTMVFFNIGFAQALDPGFWSLVRVGSRFGDIWNWRMAFLGAISVMYLLSMSQKDSQPELVRPYWVANAWMAALVIGSHSVLSHAAGSLLWPWVAISVDWTHSLAVGFWAGGLAALVLVLPAALRPYSGEDRRLALVAVLRRFSPVALVAATLVVTTGIYSASNYIFGVETATSSFGGTLAVKVALVLALLAVGGLHHIAVNQERFARFSRITERLGNLIPTLRVEAVLVIAVLFAAGWLTATPVPVPAFAEQDVKPPGDSVNLGDMTVTMSVLPGGPGVNTQDTVVTRDGERVTGLGLKLTNVKPTAGVRGESHRVEPVEKGLYVTATADIDETGQWWTLLDITMPDGEVRRAAFEWDIDAGASVIESIDPNPVNLIALGAVVMGLGWASSPYARRLYRALHLDAFSVSAALAAVLLTGGALVIGYRVVQDIRADYQETIRPPPDVVNTVLPTQESLDRGEQLYADHCLLWQSYPQDFNALRADLTDIRDETLYEAVTDGWRDLPACEGTLTDRQKWDIVNYLRTFTREPAET